MIKRSMPEANAEVLDKLESTVESCDQFSPEEVQLIKRLLEAYKGWLFVGKVGKLVILSLATIAGALAAYDYLIDRLRAWLSIS